MKKKKWLWISISAVVLIVILVMVFGGKKESREITIDKVEVRSLVENVLASGKIQPETEIKIQSQISGQIIELPIKEGDVVTQGQVLVKINPDIYISSLNRADAALNSARSSLASAKARLAQSEAQFKVQDLTMNRQKNLFNFTSGI
jgi:HlyD family secretion protein